MSRLPQPGGDNGTWGDILNDFLNQAHSSDGTLKSGAVDSNSLVSGSVTAPKLSATGGSNGKVLVSDNTVTGGMKWDVVSSGSSSPTGPAGGDLSGTYPNPTVPGLATKATDAAVVHLAGSETVTGAKNFTGGLSSTGTAVVVTNDSRLSDQRTPLDGSVTTAKIVDANVTEAKLSSAVQTKLNAADAVASVAGKTGVVTLVKGDVGLGNVDNTSDATKNTAVAALTNKDLTAGTNTFPTFNQNTTGTASNVSGTVLIANGGTGQTSATAATNALLPSQATNGGKYLTTDGTNTSWGTVATGGDASTNTATSVDSEAVLFSGISGKLLKRSTLTGIVKQTSGVTSVAVAGDFPTLNQNTTGSAASLTTPRNINGVAFDGTANITVADATKVPTITTVNGHALSANVTVTASDVGLGNVTNDAQLKVVDLDTDGTLAANSDSKIASQKAIKTYVGSKTLPLPDQLTSTATVSNTVSETAMFSGTNLTTAQLAAGKTMMRLRISGDVDCKATSGTFAIRIKVNTVITLTTTVCVSQTSASSGAGLLPWWADYDIYVDATGAGGSVSIIGFANIINTAAAVVAGRTQQAIAQAVDLSGGLQIVIAAKMQTADPANITRAYRASLQYLQLT